MMYQSIIDQGKRKRLITCNLAQEEDEDWHPRGDEAAADAAKSVAARRKRRADRAERQFIVGSDVGELSVALMQRTEYVFVVHL